MKWQNVLKRIDNYGDAWKRIEAHMAEDKIMRPKRKEQHPLEQKRTQLFKDLQERMEREFGPEPPAGEWKPEGTPYSRWHEKKRNSPEMKEIYAIDRKIDFEYKHGVGFFQGQEPEDIRPYHGFKQPKFDEAFYREKGYEPPQNKKHMKRSDDK